MKYFLCGLLVLVDHLIPLDNAQQFVRDIPHAVWRCLRTWAMCPTKKTPNARWTRYATS